MNTQAKIAAAAALLLAMATPAQARIKLTTLPERETVRVDIQNGRNTLVEEERTVNLQAGRNQVDFSWANINIDKGSIVFRVIKADGEVNVSEHELPARRKRPLLGRLRREGGPGRDPHLLPDRQHGGRTRATRASWKTTRSQLLVQVSHDGDEHVGREASAQCTVQPGVGKTTVRYFNNGERKRMLAAKFAAVPIAKRYVFDRRQIDQKRTQDVLPADRTTKPNQMGQFPLPHGKMRLFIKEGQAGSEDDVRSQAFLGEDWVQATRRCLPRWTFTWAWPRTSRWSGSPCSPRAVPARPPMS